MAAPVIAKVAGDVGSDILKGKPENLKTYAIGYVMFMAFAFGGIFLIIALISQLPAVLIASGTPEGDQYIRSYQSAPLLLRQEVDQWVADQSQGADEITKSVQCDVAWADVMAIDAVLRNQDYSNITMDDALVVARKFVVKNVTENTHEVTETIDGKEVKKTKTVKTITVTTLLLDDVASSMGMTAKQVEQAHTYAINTRSTCSELALNIYDATPMQEYPAGNASIPYYNQGDQRWGAMMYGMTGTIQSSGCGPTSLAMVVSGLTNNPLITPATMAQWAYANGHRAEGNGSYWSLFPAGGAANGLQVTQLPRSADAVLAQLSAGHPVIASMAPGHFTRGGHFIVLRGVTYGNAVEVYDPASWDRSQQTWPIQLIIEESNTSGDPFWAYLKN